MFLKKKLKPQGVLVDQFEKLKALEELDTRLSGLQIEFARYRDHVDGDKFLPNAETLRLCTKFVRLLLAYDTVGRDNAETRVYWDDSDYQRLRLGIEQMWTSCETDLISDVDDKELGPTSPEEWLASDEGVRARRQVLRDYLAEKHPDQVFAS